MSEARKNHQVQPNNRRPAGKGQSSGRSVKRMAGRPQNGSRPQNRGRSQSGSRPQDREEMLRRQEEVIRRRKEAARRKILLRQKRRQYAKKLLKLTGQRFLILLTFFSLLFGLFTGVFFLRLMTGNQPEEVMYTFRLGNVYDTALVQESYRSDRVLFFDGVLYLDALEIADYLGMTVAGDVEVLRLLLNNEAGDEALFTIGDAVVELNGIRERLLSAPVYRNGTFYLPAEFFTRYVDGVDVIVDKEEAEVTFAIALTDDCQRQLEENLDEDGDMVNKHFSFVYAEQSILVKASEPSAVIKENSISDEVKLATDAIYQSGLAQLKKEMAAAILAASEEEKQVIRDEYEETIEAFRLERLLAIDQEIAENQLGLHDGQNDER